MKPGPTDQAFQLLKFLCYDRCMKKTPWIILVTLALGTLLVGMDRTIVNLAVPRIMGDFGVTISLVGWVTTVYMLTNSMFIPVFGKLGDMFGARRVYIWGFAIFTISSVAIGFSWNIGSMIVLRAIQGLFGASVYPTAMALIATHFKEKEARAEALGAWTSILAASVVIGPLIGGPLIDKFSWPAAFFINAPLGIIAFIMALKFLPKTEHVPVSKPFDYKGAVSFSIMLVGILLVFERGFEWGWTSFIIIALAIVSVIAFYIFIKVEKKTSNPFISFGLLKNKILQSVLGVSMVIYGTLYGFMFLFSLYAQKVLHLNATKNGLMLLPLLIGVSVFSPIGGKLVKKYKPHIPVIMGLLLCGIGMATLAILYNAGIYAIIYIALGVVGIGIGLTSAPLSATATTCVAHEDVGMVSGLLNLARNISGVFFIAILTVLLALNISYQVLFVVCTIACLGTLIPSLVLRKSA